MKLIQPLYENARKAHDAQGEHMDEQGENFDTKGAHINVQHVRDDNLNALQVYMMLNGLC